MLRHILTVVLAATALAACAPVEDPSPVNATGYEGTPPVGTAITFDATGVWTWIPFPDAKCGSGSTTGLGIRKGTSNDLVVFFDGGGACWDYFTCTTGTAFDRTFDRAKFETEKNDFFPGSILDPAVLPTTWRSATLVFVPYCTGDVHGGDLRTTYTDPLGFGGSVTWEHRGHANVMAFLQRLGATFPTVDRLLVAGSSAGGFGALANYEAFRWYWPDAKGYLVDDSGPALVGSDLSSGLRSGWFGSWNLGASLDRFCATCRSDMSAGYAALSSRHPSDRIALLSHHDDATISTFLQVTQLYLHLNQLEATRFRAANTRVFFDVNGTTTDHMLLTPLTKYAGNYVASHVNVDRLDVWLDHMLEDRTWVTRK